MATIIPVGYNPSQTPILGVEQVGDLAIGTSDQDYSLQPGGIRYWSTPDLDLGYVIAHVNSSGNQPNPLSISPVYVGFWRSNDLTDASFISLADDVSLWDNDYQGFANATEAKTWLNNNGYWTSYGSGGGGTTGNYFLLASYAPADNNGQITFPNHNAGTFSLNPNLVGQSGYALYINGFDTNGNSMATILNGLIGNSGTLTLTQGANSVTYSFTNGAFFNGGYGGDQYYWDDEYESSPPGSLVLTSPASGDFNTTSPITITVTN